MNRPPFNKRELRRLENALDHCAIFYKTKSRLLDDKGTKQASARAARDAAAFARLRLKVDGMIQEKKR